MTLLRIDTQPNTANQKQTVIADDDTQSVPPVMFARPQHPLGPCGDPLSASLPSDIEWRIRRIAGERGYQNGRFLADVLCTLFGTDDERAVLKKHGRIVEEFLPHYLGKNSGDEK